jgi:hypothetical protein
LVLQKEPQKLFMPRTVGHTARFQEWFVTFHRSIHGLFVEPRSDWPAIKMAASLSYCPSAESLQGREMLPPQE